MLLNLLVHSHRVIITVYDGSFISTGTSGNTPHSDGEMCWDYRRADFERFRAELRKTDWRELLGNKIIEGKWAAFKDKLVECEAQFVPKRKCINRRLKPVWMTYPVLKCLKRKHRTFSKCKCVDHPAYVKAAKSAKSELCKARCNFETKLCTRLGLRTVLGLGLVLGSYRAYHTAGRMLILHRYSTPVAVCIASFPITA